MNTVQLNLIGSLIIAHCGFTILGEIAHVKYDPETKVYLRLYFPLITLVTMLHFSSRNLTTTNSFSSNEKEKNLYAAVAHIYILVIELDLLCDFYEI